MAKSKKSRAGSFDQIERYKATQRKGIIKIAIAVAVVFIVMLGGTNLRMYGSLSETANTILNLAMLASAFLLAVFAGSGGTSIAKSGRAIQDICNRTGITKEDIKNYEHSRK